MPRSPFADYIARFDAGEKIFAVGDEGRTLFVVQSGSIDLVSSGTGEILMTLEKGDFFGEMSLLEGSARTYSAIAREDCEAIEIGPALFDRMIRTNIELAVRMLRKLSLRLADLEDRLAMPAPTSPVPAQNPAEMPAAEEKVVAAEPVRAAAQAPAPQEKPVAEPIVVHDGPPVAKNAPAPAAPPSSQETAYPVPEAGAEEPPGWLINPAGSDVFPLASERIHVGRFDPVTGTRPEVDLTLLDMKRSVSRRHAVLVPTSDGFTMCEEVGALNGTELNGQQVDAGTTVQVKNGDQVSFGGVLLTLKTSRP